jgi:hypothetical protein
MVGVVEGLRRQVVALEIEGSIPSAHPSFFPSPALCIAEAPSVAPNASARYALHLHRLRWNHQHATWRRVMYIGGGLLFLILIIVIIVLLV